MRKFNKIKLLTSLSSIGLVATTVPVIATSCTTSPLLYGPNPNDTTIEISQIRWIKQKVYNYNTESEIIAKVKKDNRYIYSNYPGLEEATTVSAEIVSSNTINITIEVTDFEQTKYIQSGDPVSWSATYVSPAPTVKTDINNLNWIRDIKFNTKVASEIETTIKNENQDNNGAKIPSAEWNTFTFDINVSGDNISINISANTSSTKYAGHIGWGAEVFIEESKAIAVYKYGTSETVGNITLRRYGKMVECTFVSIIPYTIDAAGQYDKLLQLAENFPNEYSTLSIYPKTYGKIKIDGQYIAGQILQFQIGSPNVYLITNTSGAMYEAEFAGTWMTE